MKTKIAFFKYSGCGNDFILIDNRQHFFPAEDSSFIQKLCHRNWGIGADGLLLLEKGNTAPFRMRVFNADGSEAEMCGNGLRCFAMFLKECGLAEKASVIEVMEVAYPVRMEANKVVVEMAPPREIEWNVSLDLEGQPLVVDFLNTGVPHAVLFVEDSNRVDLKKLGPLIRYNSRFAPKGTNVDIASFHPQQGVIIRTHERGVEDETLACGTGATAVAWVACCKYLMPSPIKVITKSGESLEFDLKKKGNEILSITMKGPAQQVYSGIVELP